MLPDTNVLVAAYRADHAHHSVASAWLQRYLEDAGAGQSLLLLPMPVISGFMRLTTNPKIFPQVSPPAHAIEFIDWLLEDPKVNLIGKSSEWTVFRQLVLEKQLAANHIPDAWLAALAISFNAPFVTFDKGFRQLLPRSLLVLLLPSTRKSVL